MISIMLFLFGLPLGVWLLANIGSVIDEPNPIRPLLRLLASLCVLLAFLILTSTTFWRPFAWAFTFVVAAHLVAYFVLYRSSLGVAIYRQQPPTTPLLLDEEQ